MLEWFNDSDSPPLSGSKPEKANAHNRLPIEKAQEFWSRALHTDSLLYIIA